jgi:hypothetical protein
MPRAAQSGRWLPRMLRLLASLRLWAGEVRSVFLLYLLRSGVVVVTGLNDCNVLAKITNLAAGVRISSGGPGKHVPEEPGLWPAKSSSRGSFGIYTSNGHCLLNNRHGPTCGGLDPLAIDPERTLDPSAMLTAPHRSGVVPDFRSVYISRRVLACFVSRRVLRFESKICL